MKTFFERFVLISMLALTLATISYCMGALIALSGNLLVLQTLQNQ